MRLSLFSYMVSPCGFLPSVNCLFLSFLHPLFKRISVWSILKFSFRSSSSILNIRRLSISDIANIFSQVITHLWHLVLKTNFFLRWFVYLVLLQNPSPPRSQAHSPTLHLFFLLLPSWIHHSRLGLSPQKVCFCVWGGFASLACLSPHGKLVSQHLVRNWTFPHWSMLPPQSHTNSQIHMFLLLDLLSHSIVLYARSSTHSSTVSFFRLCFMTHFLIWRATDVFLCLYLFCAMVTRLYEQSGILVFLLNIVTLSLPPCNVNTL